MVRVNKHLIVAKQLTKRDYHQYEDKGNEQITRNMIFEDVYKRQGIQAPYQQY